MTQNKLDIQTAIVSLYNVDNANPILLDDYVFQTPQSNTDTTYSKNTKLVLIAKAEKGIYGTVTIYYNRINLSTLETMEISKGASNSTGDLYLAINENYGVDIYFEDILPEVLTAATSFLVKASPGSLMFIGSTLVTFI